MSDTLQLMIAGVIVAAVFFAVWKHGRGNPETTGHLGRKLSRQEAAIASLEAKLEGCATRGAMDLLAEQVRSLEAHSASSGEVIAVQTHLNGVANELNAKIDGVRRTADRTDAAVSRIEGYFLQKGVNGQ